MGVYAGRELGTLPTMEGHAIDGAEIEISLLRGELGRQHALLMRQSEIDRLTRELAEARRELAELAEKVRRAELARSSLAIAFAVEPAEVVHLEETPPATERGR